MENDLDTSYIICWSLVVYLVMQHGLIHILYCEQGGKPCVADFVHGSDGLGEIELPDPTIKKVDQSAAEFLVDKVSQFPGEVSILALGPLTNVALVCSFSDAVEIFGAYNKSLIADGGASATMFFQAIKKDPSFVKNVKKIVVLGGAFFASGNATPSAEANVMPIMRIVMLGEV